VTEGHVSDLLGKVNVVPSSKVKYLTRFDRCDFTKEIHAFVSLLIS
jgi:hypothetical protein